MKVTRNPANTLVGRIPKVGSRPPVKTKTVRPAPLKSRKPRRRR